MIGGKAPLRLRGIVRMTGRGPLFEVEDGPA